MIHKGRVVVAYAHAYSGKIAWMESLLKLQKFDMYGEHIIEGFIGCGGHFTTVNRNACVKTFMANENKPEWLLFFDTDIVFPNPEIIYGLYQDADAKERPIVSGLYFTYIDTGFTATWLVRKQNPTLGEYHSLKEVKPELQQVDGIGMGCVIIHRSVFEKMAAAYPREKDPWVWFGHDLVMTEKGADRLGEDLTFCRRARALGFTIWGDGRLGFTHIKDRDENVDTVMERWNAKQFTDAEQQKTNQANQELLDAWCHYAYDHLPFYVTDKQMRTTEAALARPTEANGAIIP